MAEKRRSSIHDVAHRAGVSITTVSRVINNVSTVTPQNQAKVEKAIAELNYQPDANAQRLARGLNNAIGFVIPGYPGIFHSFYAVELIRGVGHACESLRLDMIFHITNGFNDLKTSSVGGLIFADIIENERQVKSALKSDIPCMVINHVVPDVPVHYIAVDNRKGGALGAEYLYQLGHRRIAMITGSLRMQAGQQRRKGFLEYLTSQGISVPDQYVAEGDYSRQSARAAMEQLLDLADPPSAVFVASDDMALEAMAVAMERDLSIPDDISIVGYDDNPAALYGPAALTTIRQPLFAMADQAVRELNRIVQKTPEKRLQKILEPELVIRDSCAGPSQRAD
ncbi:MAG: LacI family DNA-binding transcriptional regulator [Candidatus Omnitrophota bacterium]